MNLTEKFISKLDLFLKLIPSRFIRSTIAPNFNNSKFEISIPNTPETIKIYTKQGLITIEYKTTIKKYSCNFLNSSQQIKNAINYIAFLTLKDSIQKPKLSLNQFVLSFCESDTGIVLCTETMKRHVGWGNIYMPFDSKESAIDFAVVALRNKNINCTLYNNLYEYLLTIEKKKSTNR